MENRRLMTISDQRLSGTAKHDHSMLGWPGPVALVVVPAGLIERVEYGAKLARHGVVALGMSAAAPEAVAELCAPS